MIVIIKKDIEYCNQCPYAEMTKVYTADSFENVKKLFCLHLNKTIYNYLETFDKAIIPEYCPFNTCK
jgi:hypothetical protein